MALIILLKVQHQREIELTELIASTKNRTAELEERLTQTAERDSRSEILRTTIAQEYAIMKKRQDELAQAEATLATQQVYFYTCTQ